MANNFYSMGKYKELIEKFQITFNNDKPIVKLRCTGQTVVAQDPEQQQKLDNLISDLTMIDVWIRTTECAKTYVGDRNNHLGYDETLYENAFSPKSQKDFSELMGSICDLLKTKKPQEITLSDFNNISMSRNSSRITTMFDFNQGLSKRETTRNMSAFIQVADRENKVNDVHPIDQYRETFEKYDFEIVKDPNYPSGFHVVVKDRLTNQPVFEDNKEMKKQIFSKLSFVKSWVNACGSEVSTSGKINEFGIDEEVWAHAFNDGAKNTYDKIIAMFQICDGKSIGKNEILSMFEQGSAKSYRYENSIIENLFRKRELQFATDNLISVFNTNAGTSVKYVEEQTMQSSR